jgi:alpha-D-xyloside xylohydrolase
MAWETEDEYLFGPDILVAPILFEGVRRREVYLPAGCGWIDVSTGMVIEGGKSVDSAAPIDTIPLYLKRSSALDIGIFS